MTAMRAYPLIFLAALSCSPATPDTTTNATATEVAGTTRDPAPATDPPADGAQDDHLRPVLGELKTFGDWTIGCDNGLACQANALVPEASNRDGYLLLLIDRGGDPGSAARLIVPLGDQPPADPMLRVDGKPFARLTPGPDRTIATIPLDRARAATLANGRTVTLASASNPSIDSASLTGLAAALLYMDDRQHRVGTTSALVRPGAGTTTPPPALPIIATPVPATAPPRTLTVSAATKLIGPDNAFCDYAIGPVEPEAHRLDATHSLALVSHPCGNGAYNLFSSAFIVDEQGRATPARFDAPPGIAEEDNGDIINGDWDAKAHRLTTYGKGRGIGDCGTTQSFAWDGTGFRLADQSAMGECRGSIDYIPVWRARTVPR